MTIGDKFRKTRKERNLRQLDIFNITFLARATIQQIERGKREPNFRTLKLFAKACNITMAKLLEDVE